METTSELFFKEPFSIAKIVDKQNKNDTGNLLFIINGLMNLQILLKILRIILKYLYLLIKFLENIV